MATERIDFFRAEPHNDLLGGREENEAYCRAVPGKDYLVYFPDTGQVTLDPGVKRGVFTVDRLDILTGDWATTESERSGQMMTLASPGKHIMYVINKTK